MTKRLFFLINLFISIQVFALPHAWINEIHYDNAGVDVNEFVEIIVENPESYYLGDLVLYMYNGYDGVQYCLDSIDEFDIGEREDNYQIYIWYHRGIQNDTEGMILVFKDTLVDILAYEGSFTGTNKPAEGLLFSDIGVMENGDGSDSCAIFLSGMPGSAWEYGMASPGELNPGQLLAEEASAVTLENFKASYLNGAVHLTWSTASETETSGFQVIRNGSIIASIPGQGYSSSHRDYFYIDHDVSDNEKYEYRLKEILFSGKATLIQTLKIHTHCPRDFGLGSPFPNPANPESTIELQMFKKAEIKIELYDLKGRLIKSFIDQILDPGNQRISLNMSNLSSGSYILKCHTNDQMESFEIVLLK